MIPEETTSHLGLSSGQSVKENLEESGCVPILEMIQDGRAKLEAIPKKFELSFFAGSYQISRQMLHHSRPDLMLFYLTN